MANHLTPEELSIYHGKIDKTLFQAQLQAVGAGSPQTD